MKHSILNNHENDKEYAFHYPLFSDHRSCASAATGRSSNQEREAILKSDTAKLYQLMSSKIVVHNPENVIVNFRQIIDRVKAGKIDYASFQRIIEKVSFFNDIVVVMGKEVIVPKGTTKNSGKTVTRRFTNIWGLEDQQWKLIARQSTIISII